MGQSVDTPLSLNLRYLNNAQCTHLSEEPIDIIANGTNCTASS